MPSLGLAFSLRMDGLASILAALVTGSASSWCSTRAITCRPQIRCRAFSLFFSPSWGRCWAWLSGNLIQLVFFWELTSIFSFLLIGYWHQAPARDGARMALTSPPPAACASLPASCFGHIVGSYDLDVVLLSGSQIRAHPLYLPALVLVLLGAFTKSAQFPFHFWLPQAMAAPTPVSAYLHSAAMVKAGVFLLVRLWPAMGGTDYWLWLVGTAGLVTFMLGAFLAVFQQDLKGLLAYSTISHLGLITLLIGLDTTARAGGRNLPHHESRDLQGVAVHGGGDHRPRNRNARHPPPERAVALHADNGDSRHGRGCGHGRRSLAERLSVQGDVLRRDHRDPRWLDARRALPYIVTWPACSVSPIRCVSSVTFSLARRRQTCREQPTSRPAGCAFRSSSGLVSASWSGSLPALTIGPILDTAVHAVLGPTAPKYSLAVWHGFTFPLLMSGVALPAASQPYLLLRKNLRTARGRAAPVAAHGAAHIFERVLVMVSWRWARALERILGTQRLQPQLLLLVCAALVAGACGPFTGAALRSARFRRRHRSGLCAFWVVGIACALGSAYLAKYHRLAAVILGGGAGLATCITFVWLSALDLALTQLVVEIVTTVLLLLGLRWLPKRIEVD